LSDRERGLRVLLVTLFGSPGSPPAGVDSFAMELPEAPRREPAYRSLRDVLYSRHAEDEARAAEAAALLDEIGRRTKARHVYLPLGVGGHVDHRLAHDAATRAFHTEAGRDIFFYEERPYALVPGAVRLRLAQLGVRLPPVAAPAAREASLPEFLLRFAWAPHLRAHAGTLWNRLACAGLAAGEWHRARGWRPERAFGPRVQPVVHAGRPNTVVAADAASARASLCGTGASVAAGRAERYWLLLPPREDGVMPTPRSS
jgi:hypothetical protein